MKPIAKAIRKATGLTLREFCETHLNSKWVAFSVRLRKNRLYPNEYIYICLITKQKFTDIFIDSFNKTLLFRGDDVVTKKLEDLLQDPDQWETLSRLVKSPITMGPQADGDDESSNEISHISNIAASTATKEQLVNSVIKHQTESAVPLEKLYEETY